MTMIWSSEVDRILSVGQSLIHQGVNNWALTREQALQAIAMLMENRTAILGGDVYSIDSDKIESGYDNWYCDPNPGESDEIFLQRSHRKALDYISNYRGNPDRSLFALVPKV